MNQLYLKTTHQFNFSERELFQLLMPSVLFVQQQNFPIGKGFEFDKLYIVCEIVLYFHWGSWRQRPG